MSSFALRSLSAYTPARTPLFASLPISVVSGTALEPLFRLRVVSPFVSLLVIAGCLDVETHRFVKHGCDFLDTSGCSWLNSTEPSCVVEESSACWERAVARGKRTARGRRERAVRGRRRDIACFGRLVVQAWRVAAHLGDFLVRLSCQLCRQRRCSPHLLYHFACPLLVSLSSFHAASPQALHARYSPGLKRRRAQPAPTRQCRS